MTPRPAPALFIARTAAVQLAAGMCLVAAALSLTAMPQAAHAQATPDPTAVQGLPMRNLQIEVRQVRGASQSQGRIGVQGGIAVQPGYAGGGVAIGAQGSERSESRDLVQRVLVLNGRNVAIDLGNSQPLRLVQTFAQNGVVRSLGGTVLVDAHSGFAARPVWRGGGEAELELSAMQSSRGASQGGYGGAPLPQISRTSTSVALPLDQWVTVAQSDDATGSAGSGYGGAGQSSGREALRVEVRLSVR